jgi:hypothetical protein
MKMQPDYFDGLKKKKSQIASALHNSMRWGGIEPPRLYGTWPSTMPVCQFQHQRDSHGIITSCVVLSSNRRLSR